MKNDPDMLDAIEFGDFDGVVRYSNNGKDMNVNELDLNGRTPIILASHYGHYEILSWLLSHQPDLEIRDKQGRRAIDLARANGYKKCIEILEGFA